MESNNKNIALGIFVFSASVALVLLFVIFSNSQITGQVAQNEEINNASVYIGENIKKEIKCGDSDNGQDYGIKGIVRYCDENGCFEKEDSCLGNKLIEWYCSDKRSDSVEYECKYDCDEGVCLTALKNFKSYGGSGWSSGGSSGGSGTVGGTSTVASASNLFDLGTLFSENTLELAKSESVKINFKNIDYLIVAREITETQMTMGLNGVQSSVSVGEEKRIDLDSDGTNDLYLKLRTISLVNNKAKITLSLL